VIMPGLARRLAYVGAAVLLTLLIGTLGFIFIEHYPPFDAFYMTLITMTTVGYKEIRPLSLAGRVFNSVLIFFGVTTMFFAIGVMAQTIIELELGEFFGKRRMKHMIDKLENHYIVCGYGRVGRGASQELLRAKAPFVVVERNAEKVGQAVRAGMLALQADSTRDETLLEAGVTRARGLIAALTTDADNLFVVLSARTLNPSLLVATRAAEEEAERKLRSAGANAVFAPYKITGHRLAQALLRPHVYQFLDLTTKNLGLDVSIEQVHVSSESELVSRSLKEAHIRRDLGVIVLAIRKADGRMAFNPPAEAEIVAGDYLIVMGEAENLQKLERLLAEVRS
jgi:voltage-gated potassium channel